jgi:sec-independent protein translocase protein TatA
MTASSAFLAAPLGLGPLELMVILGILLLLFGGSKLPGLAKGLGQSIKEFKKATKDEADEPKTIAEVKKTEPAKSGTSGTN